MEKLRYISFALCVLALAACKREQIETYSAANYIQFVDATVDSTTVSFVFSPGSDEFQVPLAAIMSAAPSDRELEYEIGVVASGTTAVEGTHYTMPTRTAFEAGEVTNTSYITLRRTPEMQSKSFRLMVEVRRNDNFLVGDGDNIYKIFRVHDMLTRPDWWTEGSGSITTAYFGKYSEKKYRLMISEVGLVDMTDADNNTKRFYALQFKYWLAREKAAGNTIWDDDNNEEMTVTVKG